MAKKSPKIPIFSTFINNENLQNFEGKNHNLVHGSLRTADVSPRSSPMRDGSRGGTTATQRQKFHTDEVNQCLHNKSGSDRVPNANLFNLTFLLVDFGKVLCSSANGLQKNSNASLGEDYMPQTLAVLLEIPFDLCGLLSLVCHS